MDIKVQRGFSWTQAAKRLHQANLNRDKYPGNQDTACENGFYENRKSHHIILAYQKQDTSLFQIVRPHLGLQPMPRERNEILSRYVKLGLSVARERWNQKYEQEVNSDKAATSTSNLFGIISGSILPTFEILRQHASNSSKRNANQDASGGGKTKLSIVRALCIGKTSRERVVGLLVPVSNISVLIEQLRNHEKSTYEMKQLHLILTNMDPQQANQHSIASIRQIHSAALQDFITNPKSRISLAAALADIREFYFRRSRLYEALQAHVTFEELDKCFQQLENNLVVKQYLQGINPIPCATLVKQYLSGSLPGIFN
jgi:hypothetical protein